MWFILNKKIWYTLRYVLDKLIHNRLVDTRLIKYILCTYLSICIHVI